MPWMKPELVVLVRGRPEESVLAGCKGDSFVHQSIYGNVGGCGGASYVDCLNGCQAITLS
jgi:hypothetical protein